LQVIIYICVSSGSFELIADIFTNSLALITDSTHALFDAVVTAILIIAVRLALKPRDVYGSQLVLFGHFVLDRQKLKEELFGYIFY
jgi:Co/Zn/Cd efflux system component